METGNIGRTIEKELEGSWWYHFKFEVPQIIAIPIIGYLLSQLIPGNSLEEMILCIFILPLPYALDFPVHHMPFWHGNATPQVLQMKEKS